MKGISSETLGALTSPQKGFISSIRFLEENPELAGLQLKRAIAEMFLPASFFRQEICDILAVLIELRNFLDSRVGILQQHLSHRVAMTLVHGL